MPKRPLLALALIAAPWLAMGLAIHASKAQTAPTDGRECRVVYDPGGEVFRANPYRRCEAVRIDGLCASTCTENVFEVRNRVCVSRSAVLAFHAARTQLPSGRPLYHPGLLSYPPDVMGWIGRKGGLTSRVVEMGPSEAARYLRRC